MLYLNETHIRSAGWDWYELTETIESAVRILDSGDYAQPLKPYLRYRNPENRIIAMPAYLGGGVNQAGIKWIASFPGNIRRGLPRAHSVVVLNEPDTGKPQAILNTPLPSMLRTAAVSGVMMRRFVQDRPAERFKLGIIGCGPVGRFHQDMCSELFDERIGQIALYDLREIDETMVPLNLRDRTLRVPSWQDAYSVSDICITCTVSDRRYIDLPPKKGSLQLDVSLRDYLPQALGSVRAVIVDDWEEVCRENTDIEMLHRERGLVQSGTRTLADVVCRAALSQYGPDEPVLFCPMGMAAFDIAVANYLVERAQKKGVGIVLE